MWKYRLRNGGHFGHGEMSWYTFSVTAFHPPTSVTSPGIVITIEPCYVVACGTRVVDQRLANAVHKAIYIEENKAGSWWRHQMETFSALLTLCAGNSPVTGEFPPQRPVTRSFDVFFHLCLNKRLGKHSWSWWFETPSRPSPRHNNYVWNIWTHFLLMLWQGNLSASWNIYEAPPPITDGFFSHRSSDT